MFGYVKPCKGELKIKHWNLYRAFYCGVCKALGKRYGQKARLLLNYDLAFLALLIGARKPDYIIKSGTCMVKAKKQHFAYGHAIDLAADINVLLAYFKFKDDWQDEKSIIGLLGNLLYSSGAKKAGRLHKDILKLLEQMQEDEKLVEESNCQSPDIAAIPFTQLMKGLSDYVTDKDQEYSEFFEKLGKWIYLIDALDDLEDDLKKNSYNPFKSQVSLTSVEEIRNDADTIMCLYMQDIVNAFDKLKLEDSDLKMIIENIVLAGLLEKTELVLNKRGWENFGKKSV